MRFLTPIQGFKNEVLDRAAECNPGLSADIQFFVNNVTRICRLKKRSKAIASFISKQYAFDTASGGNLERRIVTVINGASLEELSVLLGSCSEVSWVHMPAISRALGRRYDEAMETVCLALGDHYLVQQYQNY